MTEFRMNRDRGATIAEDDTLGCYQEDAIIEVTPYEDEKGWSVTTEGHWGCGVRDVGVEPRVGDVLRTYGHWGRPVHGQALNGKLLWYLTPEEQQAEHERFVADNKQRRREEFEAKRDDLDRDYDSLPALFKMRIDRFRNANPDFRWEFESYEMFTCTQAMVLAEWARSQVNDSAPGWKDEAVVKIDAWDKINSEEHDPPYDYKAQVAAIPDWSDGHSGNTHGCAVFLAKQYLTAAESVAVLPGAMSPLVGTADYSERQEQG